MTKKQYFILLWAICSVASVIKVALMLMNVEQAALMVPTLMMMIASLATSICLYGLFLSFGMDLSKKVGIRFLLLETDVDWYKDCFKPATIIGTLYACLLLVINMFVPFLPSFALYYILSLPRMFYVAFVPVFGVIAEDAFGMLFVFSGVALLLKNILKNLSMSVIMPIAIILTIIAPKAVEYIWQLHTNVPIAMDIFQLKVMADMLLVYTVCWRKSFETALLCHIVITVMLSLIIPNIIFAFGF